MQIMEIAGYGARIYSHTNPYRVSAFVVQYFMIVCVSRRRGGFSFLVPFPFLFSFFWFGLVLPRCGVVFAAGGWWWWL
jgi:hypothetical protein